MRLRRWVIAASLAAGVVRAEGDHGDAIFVRAPSRPFLLLDARRRYLPTERAHVFVQRREGGSVRVALLRVHDARGLLDAAVTRQGVSIAATPWGEDAEALLRARTPLPRAGSKLTLVSEREVATQVVERARRAVGDETAAYESSELDEGAVETWGVSSGRWGVADVDLGALPAGLYIARAHDGMWATSALVSVGDTVVLARRGDAGDRVRVTDAEGRGIADAAVEAVAGGEIVRARTNAQGDADLPASATPSRRIYASRGDDLAWTEVVHTQLPPCDTRVYIATGRPVYRPGEDVQVRGHVRGCGPVAGARVRVYPTRAGGAQGETVTADADGNFSATLTAAEVLGAEVDGRTHRRTLSLDTRPVPRSTLRLVLDRAWAAAGEEVTATAQTTDAHAGAGAVRFQTPAGERLARITPDGPATVTFTMPPVRGALERVTVEASASLVGELLTARASLWTGRVREVLSLTGDTAQGSPDAAHTLTLDARDLGGAPAPGPVSLTVCGSDGNRAVGAPRWRGDVAVPPEGRTNTDVRLVGAGPWWVSATRGEARAETVVWERPRPAALSGRGPLALRPDVGYVAPGEPLRLALRAAGPTWVTLEQGGVWGAQLVNPGADGTARLSFDPPTQARGLATLVATRVHEGRVETATAVTEVATSERFGLTVASDRVSYDAGAQAHVIVRTRTTAGRPKDAVLSLWLEDVGWWALGDERHPSVDAYFRHTGRPASAGDSTQPLGYGSEEGRRLDSGMFWNGERVAGTTFRHAWGHGSAVVSFRARGDVAALASAMARAAGLSHATMCPARLRRFGAVALEVRELPWDLAAARLAERTETWVSRAQGGLRFACDAPPRGVAGEARGCCGTGSGSGMGFGGARSNRRDQLEGTQWFLAARRIGPGGELRVDVPMPRGPGRWRLHALAIADDGAGAEGDADMDTVLPYAASVHVARALAVGDEVEGEARVRSATRDRAALTLRVEAEGGAALVEPVSRRVTPDADGVARTPFRLRANAAGAGRVIVRALREDRELDATHATLDLRADVAEQPVDLRAVVTAEPTDVDLPIPDLAAPSTLRVSVDASLESAARAVLADLRAPRWEVGSLHADRFASLRALEEAVASLDGAPVRALRDELARAVAGEAAALRAMRGSDGAVGWWSDTPGSAWLTATTLALRPGGAAGWSDAWQQVRAQAESSRGAEAARVAAALSEGTSADRARVRAVLDRMDANDLASLTWALRASRRAGEAVHTARFTRALRDALDRTVSNDRRAPCAGVAWFLCFAREGTRGQVAAAARALLAADPAARPSVLRAARWLATRPEETARWSWGSAEADVLALLAALGRGAREAAPITVRMGDTVLARGDARAGVDVTVREAGTLRISFDAAPGRFARVSATGTLRVAPPTGTQGPAALVRSFVGEGDARAMTLAFELPRDCARVEVHAPIPAGMEYAQGAGTRVAQRDPIRGWRELDGPTGDDVARVSRVEDGVRVRFTRLRAGAHAVSVPLAVIGRGRFHAGSAWLRCEDDGVWSVTPAYEAGME